MKKRLTHFLSAALLLVLHTASTNAQLRKKSGENMYSTTRDDTQMNAAMAIAKRRFGQDVVIGCMAKIRSFMAAIRSASWNSVCLKKKESSISLTFPINLKISVKLSIIALQVGHPNAPSSAIAAVFSFQFYFVSLFHGIYKNYYQKSVAPPWYGFSDQSPTGG